MFIYKRTLTSCLFTNVDWRHVYLQTYTDVMFIYERTRTRRTLGALNSMFLRNSNDFSVIRKLNFEYIALQNKVPVNEWPISKINKGT